MKSWKKIIVTAILLLALCLFSCGGQTKQPQESAGGQQTQASQEEKTTIDGWPSDNSLAQKIPVCSTGTVMNTTAETHSLFIMINDVSREESIAYWDQAQLDGYTDIVSKSDTDSTGGFTYVASNSEKISLSVTWAPGAGKGTLSLLAIQ